MSWTKDELFRRIRSDAVLEELSIRALARKYGVHRRLVREALTSAAPKPRRQPVRRSPRLDPVKKTIDEWLRGDLGAPRKQRHTARRITTRLAEELDAVVPYSTVRDYVTLRRRQIAARSGCRRFLAIGRACKVSGSQSFAASLVKARSALLEGAFLAGAAYLASTECHECRRATRPPCGK